MKTSINELQSWHVCEEAIEWLLWFSYRAGRYWSDDQVKPYLGIFAEIVSMSSFYSLNAVRRWPVDRAAPYIVKFAETVAAGPGYSRLANLKRLRPVKGYKER